MGDARELLARFADYRQGRVSLLANIGIEISNRDPLSEFAEVLVARLLDGQLADSRVQKGWDVRAADGRLIQVKYVANPAVGQWVNWHTIEQDEGWDAYALVVYLDLTPVVVYIFPRGDFSALCSALGKRHADQDRTLQFTKTCHLLMSANPSEFERFGVEVCSL